MALSERAVHYRAESETDRVRARGLGETQQFVPVGMFFGWLIENRGVTEAVPNDIQGRFLSRALTGPKAFALVGGTLEPRLLTSDADDFAKAYVHRDIGGLFLDMADWFPVPSVFDVRDTWHNYEWMRIRLVERYSEWRSAI